jgi:hypothetical protein
LKFDLGFVSVILKNLNEKWGLVMESGVVTEGVRSSPDVREGLIRTIIERAVGTSDFVKLTKAVIDKALRGDVKLRFAVNRAFCTNNRCSDAVDVFKTSVFNYLRANCLLNINNNDYIVIAVGSNGEVDTYAFIARRGSPRFVSVCDKYKLARRASYLLDTSEEFRTAVQEFTKSLAQSSYLNLPRGFTGEGEEGVVGEDVLFKMARERFGFEPELLYLGAVEEFIRDLRNVDFSRLPAGAVAALQLLLNSLIGDTDVRRVARVMDVREGFIVFTLIPWYTRLTTCFIKACLGGGEG